MPLDPEQLERLRPLVEVETGMDFTDNRARRLREAVEKVLATKGISDDLDELLANSDAHAAFLDQVTAELMVGESFFFRNEHHFRALRECVIPEILNRNTDRNEIRLWSAGCAGGEEPYSLAILLDQILQSHAKNESGTDWSISILATDINTEFLERAQQAEYRDWSFRRTNIHNDTRYFEKAGVVKRLLPSVRQHVRFLYLNLVKDIYPSPLSGTTGLDLILFRNVAIYLQPRVVEAIIQRFHRCLKPGGWLLLGEAEVSQFRPEGFEVERFGPATFLRKPARFTEDDRSEKPPGPVLPAVFQTKVPSVDATQVGETRASRTPKAETNRQRPAVGGAATPEASSPPVPARPQVSKPRGLPRVDWQDIERCLKRKDFVAAESELKRIPQHRDRARAKLKYVRRLLELPQTARAREVLDECLHEEPLLIDAHLLKACLAEERGDLAEAESSCRRALYLDPGSPMLHFHLALIQQQRGDTSGSQKSFQLVQKLAKSQEPETIAEHGDGICYGRLSEMVQSILKS